VLTVMEPTAVILQGDDILHMVTGYDETITDDSGLISVGRRPLFYIVHLGSINLCGYANQLPLLRFHVSSAKASIQTISILVD